jgi:hypothetical protein
MLHRFPDGRDVAVQGQHQDALQVAERLRQEGWIGSAELNHHLLYGHRARHDYIPQQPRAQLPGDPPLIR